MEFQGHELEWLTLGVLLLTMIAIVYGPINLIEVEFYDIEPVRAAYRIYIRHLGSALPTPDQQDRYFEELKTSTRTCSTPWAYR